MGVAPSCPQRLMLTICCSATCATSVFREPSISNDTSELVRSGAQIATRPHSHTSIADTHEKPFPCPYCSHSFQRSDVRAKHARSAHGVEQSTHAHSAPTTLQRKRVRVACDECRKRKLRCDGAWPCRQCNSAARACQYRSSAMLVPADPSAGQWSDGEPYQQVADDLPPSTGAETAPASSRDDEILVGSMELDASVAEAVPPPPSNLPTLVSCHRVVMRTPVVAHLRSRLGISGGPTWTWVSTMTTSQCSSPQRFSHLVPPLRTHNPCRITSTGEPWRVLRNHFPTASFWNGMRAHRAYPTMVWTC